MPSDEADCPDQTLTADATASALGRHRVNTVPARPSRYAVRREYARGGLGRVLLADDLYLDRVVAIKESLSPGPEAMGRFEREAKLTARLQHPGIVPVYESGTRPNGQPFYAMRMVPGSTLKAKIAEATTASDRMKLIPRVIAVADAIAYAHGQGIIHRDIKPSNVLVGEFGETVVVDWGLARQVGAPGPHAGEPDSSCPTVVPDLTAAGALLGTPAFMPPEQARGEPVDERADIYSLGALLFSVLAGEPPHAGLQTAAVIDRLKRGEPPSFDDLGASAELSAICRRAMQPDPAKRYATAHELARDIRAFQAGQLVGAYRYSRPARIRRWITRHRAQLVAASLVVLLALVAGIGLVLRNRASRRADALSERADELTPHGERYNAASANPVRTAFLQSKFDSASRVEEPSSYPITVDCRGDVCRIESSVGTWQMPLISTVLNGIEMPEMVGSVSGGGSRWITDRASGRRIKRDYSYYRMWPRAKRAEQLTARVWNLFKSSGELEQCRKLADAPGDVDVIIRVRPGKGVTVTTDGDFGSSAAGKCVETGLRAAASLVGSDIEPELTEFVRFFSVRITSARTSEGQRDAAPRE